MRAPLVTPTYPHRNPPSPYNLPTICVANTAQKSLPDRSFDAKGGRTSGRRAAQSSQTGLAMPRAAGLPDVPRG